MPKKSLPFMIACAAICIALNYIGANIALFLRLPIYLDTLGTVLASLFFGPVYGGLIASLSALLSWMTTDIFALFYAPVAIILAILVGFIFKPNDKISVAFFAKVLLVTLASTLVSALITVLLFHGITSSGSSLLVSFLHGLGLSQVLSVLVVQLVTDYLDRIIVIGLALTLLPRLIKQFPKLTQ